MEPNNQGSFGAAIAPGAGNPIMEALARRGQGGGGAPTTAQSSVTQTPIPATVSPANPSSIAPSGTIGTSSAPVAGMPPQTSEAQIIIRALNDRLKTISKIEESQSMPQVPTV